MSRLQQLQAFHEDDPNEPFILFALAMEYRKLGDLQQSLSFFQKLKSVDSNYIGLYYHLGKLLEELHRKQEATEVYKQGILVAGHINDLHARSELQAALIEVEIVD